MAPILLLSESPPIASVVPSSDNDTENPCCDCPMLPLPTSFAPCCVHIPPVRVNIQVAPIPPLSDGPPTASVFPSPDSDTDDPCSWLLPTPPLPTSLAPCCVHTPSVRVNIQVAPTKLLSPDPPTASVFPSADNDTENP